jgi:hypothetical protein
MVTWDRTGGLTACGGLTTGPTSPDLRRSRPAGIAEPNRPRFAHSERQSDRQMPRQPVQRPVGRDERSPGRPLEVPSRGNDAVGLVVLQKAMPCLLGDQHLRDPGQHVSFLSLSCMVLTPLDQSTSNEEVTTASDLPPDRWLESYHSFAVFKQSPTWTSVLLQTHVQRFPAPAWTQHT